MKADDIEPEAFGLDAEPLRRIVLPGRSATERLGGRLGELLDRDGGVLGLIGDLGAGKTTLVHGLVESLAPEKRATSPTYTLVNRYGREPPIFHIDLYRLEDEQGLESIGYWDYVRVDDAVVCVEWLDRIPVAWPGSGILVTLDYRDDGRSASIWGTKPFASRLRTLEVSP